MGAFLLLKKGSRLDTLENRGSIRKSLLQQGFSQPLEIETPQFNLYLCQKQSTKVSNVTMVDGGDFCASVGTIIYRGLFGEPALRRAYTDRRKGTFSTENATGDFCLIIRLGKDTSILSDSLGIYKVFHDRSMIVWSSSFLAISSVLNSPKVDPQSVYEYVFQEATYDNRTVFREINILDPRSEHHVETATESAIKGGYSDIVGQSASSRTSVSEILGKLRVIYNGIADCFGGKVDTALSGGYDSRLTLALLMEQGLQPRVHVYGREYDPDVQVAKVIDRQMRLGLRHIDKSQNPVPSPGGFEEMVRRNFFAFDGYPVGGVFAKDVDLLTRRERSEGGYLALNGGGGEIFRNFFYLHNRSYTTRQFIWSFYNRFDPKVCTSEFSEKSYISALQENILGALNVRSHVLTRRQIEMLYPLFRCRYWMGRNNSVNNRFGPAMTPFIEYGPVSAALNIPHHEKDFGRFEARMIRAVSPDLASFMSVYGHNFRVEPPLRRRIGESLVYWRPPVSRKFAYRLKSRLSQSERPSIMSNRYVAPLIGTEFPYMNTFFKVNLVRDWQQYNRICTLEFLFQMHQTDLSSRGHNQL